MKVNRIPFFISFHTIVAGYYGFTLNIRVAVSVRISFPDDNLSN